MFRNILICCIQLVSIDFQQENDLFSLKSLVLISHFWIPLHISLQFLTERLIPPSFTKKLSETVEETEGNSFKLEGRVAGSQPITVAWYKNNIEIHPTSNCEITFKNNALLLQVKKAGMGDAGLYTCKLSNDAGSVLCTSSVVIKGQLCSQPPGCCVFFTACKITMYISSDMSVSPSTLLIK